MVITIKYFTVTNLSTGKIFPSGNKSISWDNSQSSIISNLENHRMVTGTPSSITQTGLSSIAHMGSTYIKLTRDLIKTTSYDAVFIPDMIRITYIGGHVPI